MAYADVILLAGRAAAWLINMSVHAQAFFYYDLIIQLADSRECAPLVQL